MQQSEVLIIGAGAAGLMCAIEAAKRSRQVVVLDHANKVGKKILMSGGGRCNFTNLHASPDKYISHNPHFCKSALSRYTQWDFIELVKKYQIPYHEKTLGQLFCDNKAKDIVNMLLAECETYGVKIKLNESILSVAQKEVGFEIISSKHTYRSQSLVIASGGLSIPTMGATPLGYKIAQQFNIKVWPLRAGLVPITLHTKDKEHLSSLSGVSNNSVVSATNKQFRENILFTHRGLSGPAILQISNYWQPGEPLVVNLLPDVNLTQKLKDAQKQTPHKLLKDFMSDYLAKRIVALFIPELANASLQSISHSQFNYIASIFQSWTLKPNATEGYRTAEVTLGGVDCDALSSKTMESNKVKGLYFIGEVVDVTGWLGGYNFQWAWSSGWAAGQTA